MDEAICPVRFGLTMQLIQGIEVGKAVIGILPISAPFSLDSGMAGGVNSVYLGNP